MRVRKIPKYIQGFKIPVWWECGWRRVSCMKKSCVLCGKILSDRKRHQQKGENPDSLKCVFEDIDQSFKEAIAMIKKDAERLGIDITNIDDIKEPLEAGDFPLYVKVSNWRNVVTGLLVDAEEEGEIWANTEPAADIIWYKNILASKTYRQLCNRWHINKGDSYGDFDYKYTKYVIKETIDILNDAFSKVFKFKSPQQAGLMIASADLINLKKNILSI